METNKVLSALSYFSILFAGFLFPLVVFLVVQDPSTKEHAKKALFSHLIPIITAPFVGLAVYYDVSHGNDAFPVVTLSCVAVMVLIGIIVLIWNIVKGVKVLIEK
jgi:formate-dependent nitrite reductase membrane component NrfD